MGLSNYAEKKLLDHLLGVASFTMPSTVYLAVHTADPGEDGSASEIAATRVSLTWNATTLGAGTTSNASSATFASMPTTTLAASYFSLWDASSGGNCLATGQLTNARGPFTSGDTLTFAAGAITGSID